jgi:hypothetical protein
MWLASTSARVRGVALRGANGRFGSSGAADEAGQPQWRGRRGSYRIVDCLSIGRIAFASAQNEMMVALVRGGYLRYQTQCQGRI